MGVVLGSSRPHVIMQDTPGPLPEARAQGGSLASLVPLLHSNVELTWRCRVLRTGPQPGVFNAEGGTSSITGIDEWNCPLWALSWRLSRLRPRGSQQTHLSHPRSCPSGSSWLRVAGDSPTPGVLSGVPLLK